MVERRILIDGAAFSFLVADRLKFTNDLPHHNLPIDESSRVGGNH